MKRIPILFIFTILVIAALLSGCAGGAATGTSSWPGVSADENTAYIAYNQFIYAVNLSNGSMKWKYPPDKADPNRIFYATPALTDDGQLITGSYKNVLYSLDAATGSERWAFTQAKGRFIAAPLVANGAIYAPSADGVLYALNQDGSLRWTFATEEAIWSQPVSDEECSCLYVTSMDHHIYAVSAEDGQMLWEQDLGAAAVASPVYRDGRLFLGTFGKEVIALDAATGAEIWAKPTADWVWAEAALGDEALYIGDLLGNVYALNPETGEQIWTASVGSEITGRPVLVEGNIYFTTQDGRLVGFSPSGEQVLPPQTIGGKLNSPPVLINDTILVAPTGSDNLLSALGPNGAVKWSFIPPK